MLDVAKNCMPGLDNRMDSFMLKFGGNNLPQCSLGSNPWDVDMTSCRVENLESDLKLSKLELLVHRSPVEMTRSEQELKSKELRPRLSL